MKSNFESVTEQSGLWAGDGGYQIAVKDNTRLIGGVIASNDRAVDSWLNRLDIGTLVTEDIENTAQYSAHQVSVSGGIGFGGGDKSKESGLGTTRDGQVAGGATKEAGTSVSTGSSGLGMAMPMVAAASGSASSTTRSAISAGDIRIRNQVAQQALSGMTVTETLASLNRDTSDTLNSLSPIFDKEKIEAGFEIAQEASRQVGQFMANRAVEKEAAEKALSDALITGRANDPAAMSALMDDLKRAQDWSGEGKYGLLLLAITGGAGANVAGSSHAFVQAAAVNYLQGLTAAEVKRVADALSTGPESEVARAALHSIVGCAGAASRSAGCAAGALGAGAGSVLNSLMGSRDGLSAEEVDARRNLVTSLVTGISVAVGAEAAPAATAATLETSQNWAAVIPPAVNAANSAASAIGQGIIYVGSAALVGMAAASIVEGHWASEFVEVVVGKDEGVPGKPGEVMSGVTPPPLPSEQGVFGSEIPVLTSDPIRPIDVPGQENNGPAGGITTETPMAEVQGPALIFNANNGIPPTIVGTDGKLPTGIGGLGTPIPMPPSANPDETAEKFALGAFNGQQPSKIVKNITGKGSWVAVMPDGTAITFRPAGQASSATVDTTATVEVNNAAIRAINAGAHAKFKFPAF